MLNTPPSDPKRISPRTLLVGGLVCGFIVGFFAGKAVYYAKGYAAAAQKAETSPAFASQPITSLIGTITSVNSDGIDITVPQVVANPLRPPAPTTRHVIVDGKTMITIRTNKSADELTKEAEAFSKARVAQDSVTPPNVAPPSAYTEATGSITNLKAGMMVMVGAANDITMAQTFTATTLMGTIAPPLRLPAPPAPTKNAP